MIKRCCMAIKNEITDFWNEDSGGFIAITVVLIWCSFMYYTLFASGACNGMFDAEVQRQTQEYIQNYQSPINNTNK